MIPFLLLPVETRLACEATVIEFITSFDARDLDGMLAVFAENGCWKRPDGEVVGRAALSEFMKRRDPAIMLRHVMSNLRTRLIDEKTAVVDSYFTVYRYDFALGESGPAPMSGPRTVGQYHDTLIRSDDGWQLSLREFSFDFQQSGS
jgi:hypothetical protein